MCCHLDELVERYPALTSCRSEIQQAFETMRNCFYDGSKLFTCGNGGSAADAEHIAGELLKAFRIKRKSEFPLPAPMKNLIQDGLPVIPLTGFLSLSTAYANDVDPKAIFAQLVHVLGKYGDVLLAISTSGDAENVCLACQMANLRGMKVVGLTGASGGRLSDLSNPCIHVPETATYKIQELHLPVYHCLCSMLEQEFYS